MKQLSEKSIQIVSWNLKLINTERANSFMKLTLVYEKLIPAFTVLSKYRFLYFTNGFLILLLLFIWGFICTGNITTGSFVGRGNQYIQLVKVMYCKLPTIDKKLPTFQHMVRSLNLHPQKWEESVLSWPPPVYHMRHERVIRNILYSN